jgi:hypothetical protein
MREALDALGLPNDGTHISWPLGLRALAPGPEVRQIRAQIDALITQAISSGGNERTAEQINGAVARLRYLLSNKGQFLARTTYLEALHFLDGLDDAAKRIKG